MCPKSDKSLLLFLPMNFVTHLTQNLMRRSAWIALLALLLNALAPSLAYAMASGQERKVMVEMCASFDVNKERVVQVDDNFDQATFHGVKHCPFCLCTELTPSAPQLPNTVAAFSDDAVLVIAVQPQHLPDFQLFWSASHNRGPPSLS